ncbi:MAG: PD-(D/E)XK nuclease family protein [Candidatus Bathyarchaeia archaeon]
MNESTEVKVLKVIEEAISRALSRDVEKPKVGFYRPSLISACLRRQWLIYKRGLAIGEEKAGIFKIGELFHGFLGSALKIPEIEGLELEVPIQIMLPFEEGFVWINGRADVKMQVGDEKYVVEVKSVKRLPSSPLKHHVEQLQFYLAALNCRKGFILYIEKSAMHHRAFPVNFELEMFRGLIQRVRRLHEALTSDSKPEADAENWECRFCEFKRECDGKLNMKLKGGKNENERSANKN